MKKELSEKKKTREGRKKKKRKGGDSYGNCKSYSRKKGALVDELRSGCSKES